MDDDMPKGPSRNGTEWRCGSPSGGGGVFVYMNLGSQTQPDMSFID